MKQISEEVESLVALRSLKIESLNVPPKRVVYRRKIGIILCMMGHHTQAGVTVEFCRLLDKI